MNQSFFPNLDNPAPGSIWSSSFLNPNNWFAGMVKLWDFIFQQGTVHLIDTICIFLSLFFIILMAYCFVRLLEIRKKEHAHLHQEIHDYAIHQAEREKKAQEGEGVSSNPRWRKVLEYVLSTNASDWKLAVIEADSMLEGLLDQLGFKGESIADKLKVASLDNFRSLNVAWEVHTIRNRIAHEGSEFNLSQHEAKRVVALYESIFRQYGYI